MRNPLSNHFSELFCTGQPLVCLSVLPGDVRYLLCAVELQQSDPLVLVLWVVHEWYTEEFLGALLWTILLFYSKTKLVKAVVRLRVWVVRLAELCQDILGPHGGGQGRKWTAGDGGNGVVAETVRIRLAVILGADGFQFFLQSMWNIRVDEVKIVINALTSYVLTTLFISPVLISKSTRKIMFVRV